MRTGGEYHHSMGWGGAHSHPPSGFSMALILLALSLSFQVMGNLNLVPRALSRALKVGREKAPSSAGHMTTKHQEFVGVLN